MIPAIKKLYDYFEYLPKKKLYTIAISLTVFCLVVGIGVGQIPDLISPEIKDSTNTQTQQAPQQPQYQEKFGKVVYESPDNNPDEGISFKLIEEKTGKHIILLKASDEKLKFVEGTTAKLLGNIEKTKNGQDVLFVEKIVFN